MRIFTLLIALIASFSYQSSCAQSHVRSRVNSEINSMFRGVWRLHALSQDEGKTIKEVAKKRLITVHAHSVRDSNSLELYVETVLPVKKNEMFYNAITFKNHGVFWILTKKDRLIFIQIIDRSTNREIERVFIEKL